MWETAFFMMVTVMVMMASGMSLVWWMGVREREKTEKFWGGLIYKALFGSDPPTLSPRQESRGVEGGGGGQESPGSQTVGTSESIWDPAMEAVLREREEELRQLRMQGLGLEVDKETLRAMTEWENLSPEERQRRLDLQQGSQEVIPNHPGASGWVEADPDLRV